MATQPKEKQVSIVTLAQSRDEGKLLAALTALAGDFRNLEAQETKSRWESGFAAAIKFSTDPELLRKIATLDCPAVLQGRAMKKAEQIDRERAGRAARDEKQAHLSAGLR